MVFPMSKVDLINDPVSQRVVISGGGGIVATLVRSAAGLRWMISGESELCNDVGNNWRCERKG